MRVKLLDSSRQNQEFHPGCTCSSKKTINLCFQLAEQNRNPQITTETWGFKTDVDHFVKERAHPMIQIDTGTCGKADLCAFVGLLFLSTLFQNFAGNSTEVHRKFTKNFTRSSPEFHHNIQLEHLKKRDSHNSAFPHRSMAEE